MKRCERCGKEWPDEANFCPMDGGPLAEEKKPAAPAPAAKKRTPAPPAPVAKKRKPAARPAAPATGEPERPSPSLGRRAAERARQQQSKTRIMRTSDLDESRPTDPMLEAIDPASPSAPSGTRSPAAKAAPEPAHRGRRRFSETAWFLAAQNPDELGDVTSEEDVEAASDRYRVEKKLPPEVRRRYSLSETLTDLPAQDAPDGEDDED